MCGSSRLSSVFFVEYSFPVTAGETAHHTKEVMRVASRKMATTGGEDGRETQHGRHMSSE